MVGDRERKLLMGIRQALLLAVGVIEDYLDLPRTKASTHQR